MLQVKNVNMSFNEHIIFNNYSHSFDYNNIYCVLGKSGCGKTTLLRIMAGLLKPNGGIVTLDDNQIIKPTWQITMMHQSYSNFPFLNALKNVALPQKIGNERVDWDKCKEYLDVVGIPYHKYPHEMSGGMNQRLALARMLNTDHKVCLMDEPLSALDPITRKSMQEFLIKFNRQRKNIMIIITHDSEEANILSSKPDNIIKL